MAGSEFIQITPQAVMDRLSNTDYPHSKDMLHELLSRSKEESTYLATLPERETVRGRFVTTATQSVVVANLDSFPHTSSMRLSYRDVRDYIRRPGIPSRRPYYHQYPNEAHVVLDLAVYPNSVEELLKNPRLRPKDPMFGIVTLESRDQESDEQCHYRVYKPIGSYEIGLNLPWYIDNDIFLMIQPNLVGFKTEEEEELENQDYDDWDDEEE